MKYALIFLAFLFAGCNSRKIVEINPDEKPYPDGTAIVYKYNKELGSIHSSHLYLYKVEDTETEQRRFNRWIYTVKFKDGYGKLAWDYYAYHNEIEPQEKK